MQTTTESTRPLTMDMGVTGKVVVGGTVSTGLLLGGYVVAAMTLAGRMNGNALLLTSIGLFIVGSVIGLAISAVVGIAGHEDGVELRQAARRVAKGALFAIPACLVGSILAGWIAMAIVALYVGGIAPITATVMAALAGLGIMAATFKVTCDCGGNLFRRLRKAF
jgi:hypothetical protein